MGRFINGDRPRTSPRSRLNSRISPARFDKATAPCRQNGELKTRCEKAKDEDRPARENKPKKKKPQRKQRTLRRSRRNLVLMKSQPKLKKRSCRKRIVFGAPEPKSGKLPAHKAKNVKKPRK